jgi:hypothetical protein
MGIKARHHVTIKALHSDEFIERQIAIGVGGSEHILIGIGIESFYGTESHSISFRPEPQIQSQPRPRFSWGTMRRYKID